MNKKKRRIWFVFCVCCVCMLFSIPVAAKGKKIQNKNVLKKIVLNRKELLLYPGEKKKLCVEKVKPGEASGKVLWKSKKKAVASVSKQGELKAGKPGKTVITAVSKKNPEIKATVKVTVKKRPKKKEKECVFETKREKESNILHRYAQEHNLQWAVFRSKEDIKVYEKEALEEVEPILYGICMKRSIKIPSTFLSKYLDIDFKKESLVVFFDCDARIESLRTKFDATGKLLGSVKVHDYSPGRSEASGDDSLPVETYHATVLKISKQDEAMIDDYCFE